MDAFSERYGFRFQAHEVGDANRSARVEGPFNMIERNFLVGRAFESWKHLNQEAHAWCERINAKFSRKLHATRRELFAKESRALRTLPTWVPEVYRLHPRTVDPEGFISLHTNRYSVPYELIGRQLEVRETAERVEVFHGTRLVAEHDRQWDPATARIIDMRHRPRNLRAIRTVQAPMEERNRLEQLGPPYLAYAEALRNYHRTRSCVAVRQLLRMSSEYPKEPMQNALEAALQYRIYDLKRLESMILREVRQQFFNVGDPNACEEDDENER
jgi:hypothetical protein